MMWHRFAGVLLTLSYLGVSGCGAINSVFNRTLSAEELDKIAREVTVIIEGCGGGSGILYKREGDTYTVLTANHVISNETLTCLITTSDGKEYKAAKQITKPVTGLDLAMLKFTSNTGYRLAELGDSTQIKEADQIYVAGAPGVSSENPTRKLRVSQGNLLSDAVKSGWEGMEYLIFYNSDALPGMSGGTVLNAQGKVVGVHVMGDYNHSKASAAFNGAIPIHVLDPNKYTAQSTNEAANAYFAANAEANPEIAIEKFIKAIQLKPQNSLLYFGRANVYRFKGDYEKALADYTQAITLNHKYVYAYNNRGSIYNNKGEKDKALNDYNQAITLSPKYAEAYYNRGVIYNDKGEKDKALNDYNQAITFDPKYAEAYHNRGIIHCEKGDNEKGLADFNRAISLIDPILTLANIYNPVIKQLGIISKYSPFYYNRGLVHYNKGDKDKALADFTKAITINPKFVNAYIGRIAVYYDKRDKDKALADCRKALYILQQEDDIIKVSQILNLIKFIEGN